MDLTQSNTKRLGGYNRIQVVIDSEIISFPNIDSIVSIRPDQINVLLGWSTLKVTPGSIKISMKPERSASGQSIPVEITGSFPDDDPETFAIIKQFDQRRCIVRIKANNNQEKLYGTKENGLLFSFAPTENQKTTDSTGYTIKLATTLINYPIFIVE